MPTKARTLTKSVLIFLLTFAAGLTSINYISHFYAERALKSDAEQLLYQFHDALLDAQNVLTMLPAPEGLQCDSKTMAQLAQLSFNYPAVRLLGAMSGDENCSSEPASVDLSEYHQRIETTNTHKLTPSLSLSTADRGGHSDLLLIRASDSSYYFASINPFIANYLTEFACDDCLEYEFTIEGKPQLKFSSKSTDKPQIIEYKTTREQEGLNVNLHLRGTKTFYDYYRESNWSVTIALSTLIASICALLTYKLIARQQSLEHVIQDAIQAKEFVPYYQPVVDSRTGEVVGAEMLVHILAHSDH